MDTLLQPQGGRAHPGRDRARLEIDPERSAHLPRRAGVVHQGRGVDSVVNDDRRSGWQSII